MCHGSPDRPSALTGDNQTVGDQGYADKLNQWAAKTKTGVIGNVSTASQTSFLERLSNGLPGSQMSNYDKWGMEHFEQVQLGLDVLGMIPVIGEYFDLINGIGYASQGDWLMAGLSFAAMIPIAGWVPGAVKIGIKGGRIAKGVPPRFITTGAGVTIDRAAVSATVSAQRQGRHVLGARQYGGGSYFNSADDAQRVLDNFHSGNATVLGVKGNDIVVRTNNVTGFNHNPGAGYPNQATNVFFIKGTSSPSVVPYNPAWLP